MKNKTVKAIGILCLIMFIIIVISFVFYMYDMHNGKVEYISVYDELKDTEVFDGFFEQSMQEFFESSNIERQGKPISTAQQAKKLAQKIFYENYGLESVTVYRPFSVSHDDKANIWYVHAESIIDRMIPFLCGGGYVLLVTDEGYIIATFSGY